MQDRSSLALVAETKNPVRPDLKQAYRDAEYLAHIFAYRQNLVDGQQIAYQHHVYLLRKITALHKGIVSYILVPCDPANQQVHILFRGTKGDASVMRNTEPRAPGHVSFKQSESLILWSINDVLGEVANKSNNPIQVNIYGHSLGAADTQNCAVALMKKMAAWNDVDILQDETSHYGKIAALTLWLFNSPGVTFDAALESNQLAQQLCQNVKLKCFWLHAAGDIVQQTGEANIFVNLDWKIVETHFIKAWHAKSPNTKAAHSTKYFQSGEEFDFEYFNNFGLVGKDIIEKKLSKKISSLSGQDPLTLIQSLLLGLGFMISGPIGAVTAASMGLMMRVYVRSDLHHQPVPLTLKLERIRNEEPWIQVDVTKIPEYKLSVCHNILPSPREQKILPLSFFNFSPNVSECQDDEKTIEIKIIPEEKLPKIKQRPIEYSVEMAIQCFTREEYDLAFSFYQTAFELHKENFIQLVGIDRLIEQISKLSKLREDGAAKLHSLLLNAYLNYPVQEMSAKSHLAMASILIPNMKLFFAERADLTLAYYQALHHVSEAYFCARLDSQDQTMKEAIISIKHFFLLYLRRQTKSNVQESAIFNKYHLLLSEDNAISEDYYQILLDLAATTKNGNHRKEWFDTAMMLPGMLDYVLMQNKGTTEKEFLSQIRKNKIRTSQPISADQLKKINQLLGEEKHSSAFFHHPNEVSEVNGQSLRLTGSCSKSS